MIKKMIKSKTKIKIKTKPRDTRLDPSGSGADCLHRHLNLHRDRAPHWARNSDPGPDGLEQEVIPAHLRDLGGVGRLAGADDEFRRENVVPSCAGALVNQYAVGGPGQNNPVLQPEGFGPFRGQLNPVTWFDRGCSCRIHVSGHDGGVVEGVESNKEPCLGQGFSVLNRLTVWRLI